MHLKLNHGLFQNGDEVLANIRSEEETRAIHHNVLMASTALFMEKGFEKTTIADIAKMSGVPKSKILYEMKSKEDILSHLVTKLLAGVTRASDAVSTALTDDRIFIFMANEVLQIYMAEMNEDMRNLYLAGYSMPKTSEAVLRRRADILYENFGDVFPDFALKDFYELEIATIGIMRAYMSVPCDMYFSLETKTDRLLTTMLKIYDVDVVKIEETKAFVRQIDFEALARDVVDDVLLELASMRKKENKKE